MRTPGHFDNLPRIHDKHIVSHACQFARDRISGKKDARLERFDGKFLVTGQRRLAGIIAQDLATHGIGICLDPSIALAKQTPQTM